MRAEFMVSSAMRRAALALSVLLVIAAAAPGQGSAEKSSNGSAEAGKDAETEKPSGDSSGGERSTAAYPPFPGGFVRGSYDPLSGGGGASAGFYLNWFSAAVLIGAFALWAWSTHWVDRDANSLKVRPDFWNSLVFAGGVIGLLFALCMPNFFASLLTVAATYGLPLGLYIAERNGRVPDSSKVMTPAHIRKVAIRTLAKVGIHVGGRDAVISAGGPPIRFMGKSATGRGEDEARSRQVDNSKGILAAKELVYDAILRRGTDIHIEPKEDEMSVRLRIDGVMYPTEPFDRPSGEAIVNIFKVLSAMDITERRRPQDGSFRAELEGRDIDFRVATQGTRFGEKMSIRILDQSNSVKTLDDLGIRKGLLDQLRQIIHQPHGMMIVVGPTGAGKSTTLYTALSDIDGLERNIITIEDPIEYKMENVNQIEINRRANQTFATSLRSILRQDPDVVMVGEIRDGETATIACQAANTGHMVFSTLHANDTITGLYRLMELGVDSFMVANSLSALVAQRLTRKLCPECREAYKPNAELLKQAGLPPDKVEHFYRPPKNREESCPKCNGMGYYGRAGVYEVLSITDRMRDLIREKASVTQIKAEARKNGMLTMKEEGLRLVVRGVTSIDELLRVVK